MLWYCTHSITVIWHVVCLQLGYVLTLTMPLILKSFKTFRNGGKMYKTGEMFRKKKFCVPVSSWTILLGIKAVLGKKCEGPHLYKFRNRDS